MATYPVVERLPSFEDKIQTSWPQEFRGLFGDNLVYCITFNGNAYDVHPLSGIDQDYVSHVTRTSI